MALSISAIFIALCFGIVTVYAVLVIQKLIRLMQRINEQLNLLIGEANKLMRSGQLLAEDAQLKLLTLSQPFSSFAQAGNALGQIAGAISLLAQTMTSTARYVDQSVKKNQEKIREFADWVAMGTNILQKYQAHRNRNED